MLQELIEPEESSSDFGYAYHVFDNEDILLELDGSNNIVGRYTHGEGFDAPVIVERGSQPFFSHADGLGSITEITNRSGALVQAYAYSSFGKIESQLDPNFIQPYTFTAREFDPETELYHYRERQYDWKTGRFNGVDPIGFTGGDINLYTYVRNNPVTFTDPDGLIAPAVPAVAACIANPACAATLGALTAATIYQLQKAISATADLTLDLPRIDQKGRWTCRARCNVQAIGDACCPDRVEGIGTGPSEEIACRNAKRAATQSAPRGCYARHCQCACTKD